MDERGTPTDPGLGLLRFAMGRLDDGATLRAQERLDAAPALRTLVEEPAGCVKNASGWAWQAR